MKFFFDRWTKTETAIFLREALGEDIIHHDEIFPRRTDDVVWLPWAAEENRYVFTHDEVIHRNKEQKRVIYQSRNVVFILPVYGMSAWERFELFVLSYPYVKRAIAENPPPKPSVYRIPKRGLRTTNIKKHRKL